MWGGHVLNKQFLQNLNISYLSQVFAVNFCRKIKHFELPGQIYVINKIQNHILQNLILNSLKKYTH